MKIIDLGSRNRIGSEPRKFIHAAKVTDNQCGRLA